ncbi:hypothetical protein GQ44DRAFT_728196 [Phaeosphaeriaceae sp. PMI808]|nr:hypothetical protein GQ44DRAFT_728196 [Phaeosphaeriaceae sp. PMI808]
MAPPLAWRPPSSEEFLADIEHRKSQPVLYERNDMISATNFLAETGQEEHRTELKHAIWHSLRKASLLLALQLWLGTITLEIWKLSISRGLRKSVLRMRLLSLKMHLRLDPSVLQQ